MFNTYLKITRHTSNRNKGDGINLWVCLPLENTIWPASCNVLISFKYEGYALPLKQVEKYSHFFCYVHNLYPIGATYFLKFGRIHL